MPLPPGTVSETTLAPLCKLTPGHMGSASVITVTGVSLAVARVYYTHAIGLAHSLPPVSTITSTVALIGAKTPNRTGMTR